MTRSTATSSSIRPLNIVIVSQDFLPNNGGIAVHVFELVQNLAMLGHKIFLIAGYCHEVSTLPEMHANITLIQHKRYTWSHWGQISCAIATYRSIKHLQRTIDVDVIHWHNLIYESIAMRLTRTRAITVFTNHSSGYTRRLKSTWRRLWQLPFLLKRADVVICPSLPRVEVTKTCYQGRIECIPNGVNSQIFQPRAKDIGLLKVLGLSDDQWVIAAPVRAEHVKGIDRILNVWKDITNHVPNVVLLIFGSGEAEHELRQQVLTLEIEKEVFFLGGVPKERMSSFYNLSDVCVMLSREEGGVPFSALESLSCGTPLVATAVGGLQDLKSCTDGVVLIDDESDLTSALLKLYESAGPKVEVAASLHKWVKQNYSSGLNGQKTSDEYASVINERLRSK